MQSLPDLMYNHLKEGLLPKFYPSRPLSSRLYEEITYTAFRRTRRRRRRRRHHRDVRRALGLMGPVSIVDHSFRGYRSIYRDLYLTRVGDKLTYAVRYSNETARPVTGDVDQSIGDVAKKVTVLFMPKAPYDLETEYGVEDPVTLVCSGSIKSGIWSDSVSDQYPIGVFDDRSKPVGEYPVSGIDNAILDLAYDWKIENLVYPLPLASELRISNMSVRIVSGFTLFEGKYYKDPSSNNTVEIRWTLKNVGDRTITINHWGLPLSVVYEDSRRVSQMDVDVSVGRRTLGINTSTDYAIRFNLPIWNYGRVAVAHAVEVLKDSMPLYYGGPFMCFEVGRLRLP